MATPAAAASAASTVRQTYRTLGRLIQKQPDAEKSWKEFRTAFRRDLQQDETVGDRLKKAGERIAFLRMITPKDRRSGNGGRWIYKDGKPVEGASGTSLQGKNVHTNWDGTNMDPCSVKRHTSSLKRAGFVNNLHAKGLF